MFWVPLGQGRDQRLISSVPAFGCHSLMAGLSSAPGWINSRQLLTGGEMCRRVWAEKRCESYDYLWIMRMQLLYAVQVVLCRCNVSGIKREREKERVSVQEEKSSPWEFPDWVNGPPGEGAELLVSMGNSKCWTREGGYLAEGWPESLEKDKLHLCL